MSGRPSTHVPDHATIDRKSRGDGIIHPGDHVTVVELMSSPWRRDVTGTRDLDRDVAWQRLARQGTVVTQAALSAV